MKSALIITALLAGSTGFVNAQANTGGSSSVSFGAVRPGNLVLPQISVQIGGDPTVGKVIQNDLDLADIAVPPKNAQAATEAANKDKQAGGGVNYEGWTAAGVTYVLRGMYGSGNAQIELYDIASKQRVLGKSYTGAAASDPRRLGHKIADDIMIATGSSTGIFSAKIALLTGQDKGNREVMVMDPDGANTVQLTSERAIVATPAWGRRGQEIFFTSYKDNNPDLYGITLDRRRFVVSRRPGLNTSPAWSDKAGRLAVSLSKDGNNEIYTMTADGGSLARLTNSPAAETAPTWSPDGSQIAYTSDASGQPNIYVMSANGGGARKISSTYSDSPTWSPDGKKLAYVVRDKGEFNIYMADLASGTQTQLTKGAKDNLDPSWAPNSKHLIFRSNRSGGRDIYIVNSETKVAKKITGGGTYSYPSWGPLQP